MLGKRKLNLFLSPEVQEWLDGYKLGAGLNDPLPGVIYGRWEDETEDYWTIGLYERADLPKIDMWLCEGPDWEFLIHEGDGPKLLEGKTSYFRDGRLVFE